MRFLFTVDLYRLSSFRGFRIAQVMKPPGCGVGKAQKHRTARRSGHAVLGRGTHDLRAIGIGNDEASGPLA